MGSNVTSSDDDHFIIVVVVVIVIVIVIGGCNVPEASTYAKKVPGINVTFCFPFLHTLICHNMMAYLFTGASPYPGVDNRDIYPLVKSGYRMEKPDMCSDEL